MHEEVNAIVDETETGNEDGEGESAWQFFNKKLTKNARLCKMTPHQEEPVRLRPKLHNRPRVRRA